MADVRLLSLKSSNDVRNEISKIGSDEYSLNSLAMKGKFIVLKIHKLNPASCNIIKQIALSSGTDAAVHRDVITGKQKHSDLLLFGTLKEIERIGKKLRKQPFGLDKIGTRLLSYTDEKDKKQYLNTAERKIEIGKKTLIMGILNVTTDSFSDGGKYIDKDKAVNRALKMVEEGADMIDIGGESSRPGAEPVSLAQELKRVIPVLTELRGKIDVPISIDTYKNTVAEKAIEMGAEMVNDISGLRFDKRMVDVVRENRAAIVIMHMKGRPRNMQNNPCYDDVIQEIYNFLQERADFSIKNGIDRESIVVDPGIGFGKRVKDNLVILNRLREFKSLGFPVLIGTSKKSFIGATLYLPMEERLEPNLAACGITLEEGVDIVRVHDVAETRKFIDMFESIRRERDSVSD